MMKLGIARGVMVQSNYIDFTTRAMNAAWVVSCAYNDSADGCRIEVREPARRNCYRPLSVLTFVDDLQCADHASGCGSDNRPGQDGVPPHHRPRVRPCL
jgi:hypothetical protein